MTAINLKLKDLLTNPKGQVLSEFVKPRLTLSKESNVGVIIGNTGSGKTYLATQIIQHAIEQHITTLYIDSNLKGEPLTDSNSLPSHTLIKLAEDNPTRLYFNTLTPLTSTSLVVIDEFTHCASNDDHRQLAKALSHHIENGGLLIMVSREQESIETLLDSKARIGFTATAGASVFAHRTLESPSEAVVMKLLQKKAKTRYTWFCESQDQLAFGTNATD
ncbi:ATP-binding protein (plasmid) [Vibrio harveyi]|uniref:ATP-binding protein n=2 Tax=Vibrio harveyi TaxID=669 RepID=UPI0030FC57B6